MEAEGYFLREFAIEGLDCHNNLTLFQKEVGDVSCVVWDAALVLSKYLEVRCGQVQAHWLKGKQIVELGAGVGCVGLTAACLGGHVTMTDLPDVIDLLQKNITANQDLFKKSGGKATTKVLEWGTDIQDWEKPQLLLMADCVYYEESVEPLVKTMCDMTTDKTEILLCQEERISEKQINVWKKFQHSIEQHFVIKRIPKNEQHDQFFSPDICLLDLKRKKKDVESNDS